MENDTPVPVSPENNNTVPGESLPMPAPPAPPDTNSVKKKKLSLAALITIVAVLLIGGSAAAYFGIVVPNNKPENVLKKAFANSAQERKSKFSGKFSFESTDPAAELKAVNVTFDGQSDLDNNAFQTELEVTASGFKFPLELRGIDKSIFFKIGDLGGVKSLVQLTNPDYAPLVDFFNQKYANKWMEIDETLLKQAGTECVLDMSSYAFTEDDMKLIQKRYDEVPFAAVKSQTDDSVNGRAATKYELEIDDNKASEFGKGLDELSVIKKIKECSKSDETINTDDLADGDKTPLTVWVDKSSKTITKLATQTTKQDEEKDQMKGSFEMTVEYGDADIEKPEGARPVTEVIGELYGALLQSGATNPMLQNSVPAGDLEL